MTLSECNRYRKNRKIYLVSFISDHCMVSFVKPNLLGTRKEFMNRFVNPITNGQHKDSTTADVTLMKRRAHILHEMLAGCVQVLVDLSSSFHYVMGLIMRCFCFLAQRLRGHCQAAATKARVRHLSSSVATSDSTLRKVLEHFPQGWRKNLHRRQSLFRLPSADASVDAPLGPQTRRGSPRKKGWYCSS